jgi:hypothetical protein
MPRFAILVHIGPIEAGHRGVAAAHAPFATEAVPARAVLGQGLDRAPEVEVEA